ncbi:MAG: LysR family transcriptional regulator [Clostridiales bacterium]|nr:LysR family transcriptional regulator [Clostridiales bacterium]
MELRQFTYVNMVASCGSFTKAAAKLFISQPALSNYINKVEEELGVRLFDRSASQLVLTYAGEEYLKRTKIILSQIEDMDREMRDIAHHMKGRLRIGFPSERIIYILPLILAPFKECYPGIDVEVVNGSGSRLIENLRAGDVDFVFLPNWTPIKDIANEDIAEEELVLVAAEGYLPDACFLSRENHIINWREVSKLPIITLKKGHALRKSVDVLFQNAGRKPQIFFESHSNMLSYRLAAQGLGVAIIPDITLELMEGSMPAEVCHLSEHPVTWPVSVLYRENCYIGKVERTLFEIAKEAMAAHKKWL